MKWQRFEIHPLKSSTSHFHEVSVVWCKSDTHYSGKNLFHPLLQTLRTEALWPNECSMAFEVSFHPAMTDNQAAGFAQALRMEDPNQIELPQVHTGTLTFFSSILSDLEKKHFSRQVCNPLLQQGHWKTKEQYLDEFTHAPLASRAHAICPWQVHTIPIFDQEKMMALSTQNSWGFSIDELDAIANFYKSVHTQERRQDLGLPLIPTDVEIEILAQSWSEHCKHKIFRANISHRDETGVVTEVDGLFKQFIQEPSFDIIKKNKIGWTRSLFSDNAGVVNFDGNSEIALKVETHNTPSVLDPYGGALTGILGVNRDILGTGLGARPIANLDVLVFGDLNAKAEQIPDSLFHPTQMMKGVHRGIADGGNKSGIPTINGSMSFYPENNERPLVYCGTLGIMNPGDHKKEICENDLIIMVGGRIGRDGIHGATASSESLHGQSHASIVQLGDPYTQKKMTDFILAAKERALYRFITDNGAGGLSSSVGEMADTANGAHLNLQLAPLKTPGLSPWEIVVSESQERMTLAVAPERWKELQALANLYEVEVSCLGHFNRSGEWQLFWGKEIIGHLPLDFLHRGTPQLELKSSWKGSALSSLYRGNQKTAPLEIKEKLLALLGHPNVADKSPWVGQFDQEVGGASRLTPYKGGGAGALELSALNPQSTGTLLVAHGLNSPLSLFRPEIAAARAVDEAVRNLVVHGVELGQIALTDNFCTPDPLPSADNVLAEQKLGALVEMAKAMSEAAIAFKAPFISGKDSMKNDYKTCGQRKSIAPTLLITALGYMPQGAPLLGGQAQKVGNILVAVGGEDFTLQGSLWDLTYNVFPNRCLQESDCKKVPLEKNAQFYKLFHQLCQLNVVQSAQDVSEGGTWVAALEMTTKSGLGLKLLSGPNQDAWDFAAGEGSGRIIVEIAPSDFESLCKHFQNHSVIKVGEIISDKNFILEGQL